MSEPGDDVIVVRTVTVREVMDAAGQLRLDITSDGDPTVWQQLGMLAAGVEALRIDMAAAWQSSSDEDDE